MKRPYEVVYIFDTTLEDSVIADRLTAFHALLGDVANMEIDNWGRRQLAYKIGTRDQGYYAIARFEAEPTVLPEFERAIKLDESVIRYLVTVHEHDVGAAMLSDEDLLAARRADDDEDED